MLDIVLNILAVLGIIILALLVISLVLLILILFFPISYRIFGSKSVGKKVASVKLYWLFGLLRGRFEYPEPGKFIVKFLWFNVYDSSKENKNEEADKDKSVSEDRNNEASKKVSESGNNTDNTSTTEDNDNIEYESEDDADVFAEAQEADTSEDAAEGVAGKDECPMSGESKSSKGIIGFISAKYEKIKYTILKIYDKIKHVLENISFYINLLEDEQTKGLLQHVGKRLQKIWKNIHPRTLKANVVFGTGSPDTTGYAMGLYGILSPMLGKDVIITPDFSEAVFKGEAYIAGHITVFQVLFHSLMVLLDKRLKLLIKRLKKGKGN